MTEDRPEWNCQVKGCLNDSGRSMVCDQCRKTMNPNQKKKMTELWHDIICTKEEFGGKCFHCNRSYERDQLAGDHWPFTKAARPDLRYNIDNGRPTCAGCNTSGSKYRKDPVEWLKENNYPEF